MATKYGLVKTLKDGESEIKLCGNAMTFVLYKSYFGRDLLNDIVEFAKKNSASVPLDQESKKILLDKDFAHENVSLDDAREILESIGDFQFDSEFILNFIVALMATAQYPSKPDIADLILQVPPHFIMNQEIVGELLEFLSIFIKQKQG